MKKVLLDANVLVAVIRNRIDVAEQLRNADFEPSVSRSVMGEVKTLGKALASAVEAYLKANKIVVVASQKTRADEDLLALSEEGFAIATLDAGLKRRLKKAGAQVITLARDKRRVQII